MADRAWRVLRWAAGLAIVVFVARSVAGNWDQVRAADLAWRFRALPLLAGVATVWAVFALLALAWRRMVAGRPSRTMSILDS